MKALYIIGDISMESYSTFCNELDGLISSGTKQVCIELTSDGGDAYAALAYYDKIISSKIESTIIGRGLIASAAVLILAAGKYRYLAPSAWVMVHDDVTTIDDTMRVHHAKKELAHSVRLEDQWNTLLEQATGTSAHIWADLHTTETWLTPQECIALGLVTSTVPRRDSVKKV